MMSDLKVIAGFTIVLAAIGLTAFLAVHHALMPDRAELAQIDAAVQAAAPPGSAVHRLNAPDNVEWVGHAKFGYFTYEASGSSSHQRYRADWRISDGKVQLVSFKPL